MSPAAVWTGISFSTIVTPFHTRALEERVTENAIALGSAVEIRDACVEARGVDQTRRQRRLSDPLHHGRERLPRESIDQIGPARIDVHHPGRDADLVEPGLNQ